MTLRVITQAEIEARKRVADLHDTTPHVMREGAEKKETSPEEKRDSMLSALSKYVPVTVIVGYTFLDTIFRAIVPPPALLWMAVFVVMLAGAGLLTFRITAGDPPDLSSLDLENPDIKAVLKNLETVVSNQRIKQSLIAMIAFAGYVPAIGGPFTYLNQIIPGVTWQPYYGSVILVMATLAIAIIAAKDLLAE